MAVPPQSLAYPACPFPSHPPPVRVPLTIMPDHPCAYLPGRVARSRAFAASNITGDIYHGFMDAGFRRSGRVFYQPICTGCRSCLQIRVPVARFKPTKSQRRSRRRNADLSVTVSIPDCTDEKHELYQKYLRVRHNGLMDDDRSGLEMFLYESPVETLEVTYRDPAGKLLGVGICDICSRSLSSVYFYYDPDQHRRGLGIFSALYEINLAQSLRIPFYYLGYWVENCKAMAYKSIYRPCEVLTPEGKWRELT